MPSNLNLICEYRIMQNRHGWGFLENKLLKALVFIVLPFVYGFMLPHTETLYSAPINSSSLTSGENGTRLDYKTLHDQVTVPDTINSVFPLAKYFSFWPLASFSDPKLCFQDSGSYVSYTNGTPLIGTIEWNVSVENITTVTVAQNSVNCTDVTFGAQYEYTWQGDLYFLINRNASLGDVSVVPMTSAYHSVQFDYGILQGVVFIPALYLFFWYPIFGIIKKIDKGWKEQ